MFCKFKTVWRLIFNIADFLRLFSESQSDPEKSTMTISTKKNSTSFNFSDAVC